MNRHTQHTATLFPFSSLVGHRVVVLDKVLVLEDPREPIPMSL